MLKGFGQFFGAILGALMPWVCICITLYFYGPKLHAYWAVRERAYALVPQLQSTIAQDKQSLQNQKDLCKLGAARAQRTGVLVDHLAAAPSGLNAAAIEDLLK